MTTWKTTEKTEKAGAFYADAARARIETGRSGCCAAPVLDGAYEDGALAEAPAEAVNASFGCGDPVAFAEVREGQSVVDLGCGAGLDLILAAEKTGATGRVIGVDASAEMLALAQTNIERANVADRVELRQGVIEALPLEDRSVDWVISNCVVNLSPDKAQVFREIRRVLKPGGAAVIADIMADDLPGWIAAHSDLHSACVAGAVSEEAYLRQAAEAGLINAKALGRLDYDGPMLTGLIDCALPLAVDEIAANLAVGREELLAMAARDLAGRIRSVKLRFERAPD